MIKKIHLVVLAAGVAAVLAGCGSATPQGAPATGPTTGAVLGSASPSGATPTSSPGTDASAPPILPDGRSPILVTTVDPTARTLKFDLVELYLGTAARTEWMKDHPGATEVPPLNGHYLRNNNPKLRTLPVAIDVVVHVIPGGDPDHPDTISFAAFASYPGLNAPFWITVKNGTITLIEQQFTP